MVCTYEAKRSVEIPLIVAQGDGFFGIDAVRMHVGDKRSRILPSAVLFRDDPSPVYSLKRKRKERKRNSRTLFRYSKSWIISNSSAFSRTKSSKWKILCVPFSLYKCYGLLRTGKSDKTTCNCIRSVFQRTKEYKLRVILERSGPPLFVPIGGRLRNIVSHPRGGGEPAISRFQRLSPDPPLSLSRFAGGEWPVTAIKLSLGSSWVRETRVERE